MEHGFLQKAVKPLDIKRDTDMDLNDASDKARIKVLLVEDDEDDFVLIRAMLSDIQAAAYDLDWVRTYQEALGLIGRVRHDVYLLDYYLGARTGLELVHEMEERLRFAPVIFLSAHGGHHVDMEVMVAGAADYLDKAQLHPDLLERSIRYAIECKRGEEALQKSERYFRSLLFNLHEDVLVIDRNYRIKDVNRDRLNATGHGREEVIGRHCYEMAHGLSEPCSKLGRECRIGEVFETGRTLSCRHEHVQADGSKVWVDVFLSPLRNENQEITHVIQAVRNVTDEVDLERKFLHAQKMEAIGVLSGGIAHDFNNILTPIISYTELALTDLRQEILPNEAHLQHVLDAATRAKNLVKRILTFSLQNEQKQVPVRVSLIVGEALRLLRATLPTTIEIFREITSEDEILGDPTQIHQILLNLCTNAAHAMRENGGELRVSLSSVFLDSRAAGKDGLSLKPGPFLKLVISDTGHGIDPGIMDKIFDPFFTTKVPNEGTGLGLSVTHGIVKTHGGAINVRSIPGKGTTFEILLPTIDRIAPEPVAVERPIPRGCERILYVDDEPTIVYSISKILELLGYQVDSKTSSIEALESFRLSCAKEGFDLVITDMTMPAMTGLDLACEILRLKPDTPIILCTGFSEMDTWQKAKSAGVARFISKPIITRELAETIRDVLDSEPGKRKRFEACNG